jgi:hypothetical protein
MRYLGRASREGAAMVFVGLENGGVTLRSSSSLDIT